MRSTIIIGGSIVAALLAPMLFFSAEAFAQRAPAPILVDDFEQDEVGTIPSRWWGLDGREAVPLSPSMRETGEYYRVHHNKAGRYLKLRTEDESLRLVFPNGRGIEWDLHSHPQMAWRWRAHKLPPGAREDDVNDVAGAVYVTFSFDWLRRPRSIKYTYSTSLPVGTVIDQGRLKVIVVSSGRQDGSEWVEVNRDVLADYRRVFGHDPPPRPISIALWSDSDTTQSASEIDIDELLLLPHPRTRGR